MLPSFPPDLHPWTLDGPDSSTVRDPINVLVANSGLSATLFLVSHVRLKRVSRFESLAPPQWFRHLVATHRSDESVATSRNWLARGRRLHARVYSPGPAAPGLGVYTALTAHLDRLVVDVLGCGATMEVSTSFTQPREDVAARLRAIGSPVDTITTRNLGSVRQCDGTRVVADGRVAVVR